MADGAAKAITGSTDGLTLLIQRGVTAQDYATIVTLMTVAIIAGPVLVVLFYKKLQPKLAKLGAMKVGGAVDPDTATKNLESDAKKANPNGTMSVTTPIPIPIAGKTEKLADVLMTFLILVISMPICFAFFTDFTR